MDASSGLRRRLRPKTHPPPQPIQHALPEPLRLEVEAAMTTKCNVYRITFPRPWQRVNAAGLLLIAPDTLIAARPADEIAPSRTPHKPHTRFLDTTVDLHPSSALVDR